MASKRKSRKEASNEIQDNLVELFGLNNVQHRKEWFRQKAAGKVKEAEKLQLEAAKYIMMADALDQYNTEAMQNTAAMISRGKKRLDGKTAEAMGRRGMLETCGIVYSKTKIHCVNEDLEIQEVAWADKWFTDVVEGLKKSNLSAQERTAFYDRITEYRDEPEGIQSEAGLVMLERLGK